MHLGGGEKIDGVFERSYDDEADLGLDVTIVCGDSESYIDEAHATDGSLILAEAERAKVNKHGEACKTAGIEYFTVAASTYGAIGKAFKLKFKSYYKEALAKAKAAGESTWEVLEEKRRWLETFSIAICEGNRDMVGAAITKTNARGEARDGVRGG